MADPDFIGRAKAILPFQPASNKQSITRVIEDLDREEAEDKRSREEAIGDIEARGGDTSGLLSPLAIRAEEVINEARDAFSAKNLIGGIVQTTVDMWSERALNSETDPSGWYDLNKEELTVGLTPDEQADVADTPNLDRARAAANHIREEKRKVQQLSAGGLSGLLWTLFATVADVDTVVPLTPLYKAAKAGRAFAAARQFGKSAVFGGITEGINVTIHSQMDSDRIIENMLMTGLLGGSVAAYRTNKAARLDKITQDALNVHYANIKEGVPGSAGAMRNPNRSPLGEGLDPAGTKAAEGAEKFAEQVDTAAPVEAGWISKGVKKLVGSEAVTWVTDLLPKQLRNGMKSDFERLNASSSKLAKKLAVEMFEDPTRKVMHGTSAAVMERTYQKQILGAVLPEYNRLYNRWATKQGASWKQKHVDGKLEDEFGKMVTLEMNSRRVHGKSLDDVDPLVKEAADHVQKGSDISLAIGQGRAGQRAVDGLENVNKTGYLSMNWKAEMFARVGKEGGIRRADLEQLFADGYKSALPDLTEGQRLVFAKALVSRQLSKAEGADDSLLNLLGSDGRAKMRQQMIDNGVSAKETDQIIKLLSPKLAEKGKVGLAKHRTEIDMSVTHGEFRIVDFLDTNINRVVSKHARTMAGRAALARKGITNSIQKEDWIRNILDEQTARHTGITQTARDQLNFARKGGEIDGVHVPPGDAAAIASAQATLDAATLKVRKAMEQDLDRDFIEGMFSYFEAGPIAGGVHNNVRRMKQLTNLGLMSQLGIPQLGETGALIAASGVEAFIESSPILQRLTGRAGLTKEQLARMKEELEVWTGKIGDEHLLIRDDLALDYARKDLGNTTSLDVFDLWLAKGQRAQGYISGFYAIRSMQHKAAVMSMTGKVAKILRDGPSSADYARLSDIGIDGKNLARIRDDLLKHAEWSGPNRTGFIIKLNMDKWSMDSAETFGFAMNRHTDQVVQKAMAGETSLWMHTDIGSLLSQYRAFPLLAMRKQVARNIKLGDPAMGGILAASMATATLAYVARQLVNNNPQNLTLDRITMGAIQMSNVTSALVLPLDPLSAILGLDYANRYGNPGIFSMPALDQVNKIATGLGHLNGFGEGNEVDLGRASRAIPIIGGAFGARALFDAMKN